MTFILNIFVIPLNTKEVILLYTIIMSTDKSLITTVKTTLYQREKLADKIQFLFPQNYGDLKLSEFTATLKYLDHGNEAHAETLIPDEELYKDMIRFVLPIDTDLNRFANSNYHSCRKGISLIYLIIIRSNGTVTHNQKLAHKKIP